MAFYIDPTGDRTRIGFRTNLPAAREHWTATIQAGRWYRVAMEIGWTQIAEQGRVSVWLDGEPVVTGAIAQTKPNSADLFIQMGYHRDASQKPVETILLDGALEGTGLEDMMVKTMPLRTGH